MFMEIIIVILQVFIICYTLDQTGTEYREKVL